MRKEQDGRRQIYSFDSFTEFMAAATSQTDARTRHSRKAGRENAQWTGTSTWAECLDIAYKGWPEGRYRVDKLMAKFGELMASVRRPQIVYDVQGDVLDVGRYMSGEPECVMTWQESEADTRGPKLVKIVYNFAASGSVDTEVMMMRGAAMAACAQALELSGRRTEIWCDCGIAAWGDDVIELRVCVKAADQPLQLDQLAFTMVHPSMLRRLLFSWMETLPAAIRSRFAVESGSYGRPVAVTDKGLINLGQASLYDRDWTDAQHAREWVKHELLAQNVVLEG